MLHATGLIHRSNMQASYCEYAIWLALRAMAFNRLYCFPTWWAAHQADGVQLGAQAALGASDTSANSPFLSKLAAVRCALRCVASIMS